MSRSDGPEIGVENAKRSQEKVTHEVLLTLLTAAVNGGLPE
jgi:hypothetical protein